MPITYLTAKYKEKDRVKALGAQFDSEKRAWFVPDGLDLAPFAAWLPHGQAEVLPVPTAREVVEAKEDWPVAAAEQSAGVVATQRRGVTLSQLMLGVTQAVARAYPSGVWTLVEVIKADARNGNVYLELAERSEGRVVAQARGTIWASEARRIIPEFQRATGVVLGAGIKLLVRAKPSAHAVYGLSVGIDAIDPDYTLGDLEAKRREIRTRLQREGLFGLNKQLPAPWDFNSVVVVAPQGAAGLGDFQAEADRLAKHGVCRFVYANSRFQGEGAAQEIRRVLLETLDRFEREMRQLPDAVAIIRGGGAVNDLAWLDDYDLARCICELRVPVLTGIGHERDNTVLDEVAHTRFDTPSKVIGGIEHLVMRRAQEAKASFTAVVDLAGRAVQTTTKAVDGLEANVRSGAQRHLASAKQETVAMLAGLRLAAMQMVRRGSEIARERLFSVRAGAAEALGEAKREVPAMFGDITAAAARSVVTATAGSKQQFGFVVDRARSDVSRACEAVGREMADVRAGSDRTIAEAKERSEAMMREIAGQGPSKTLGRGFAVVRHPDGKTITSAAQAEAGANVEIEFRDGIVKASTQGLKLEGGQE